MHILSTSVSNMMGNQKPAWLETLCNQKFFAPCSIHKISKKNEMNICCLDCCSSICPHCVQYHRFHRLLQIRRYVYPDVVRLEDLEKLIDCSNVQAYTINGAKVVFIRKRPQNRQFKGSANFCTSCDRSLQEPFYHCSLGCKVEFVLKHCKDLSPLLRICNSLPLGPEFFIPQDAMGDHDHNDSPHSTVVDSDDQLMMSYYSSSSGNNNNNSLSGSENMENSSVFCMVDFVRKKRSGVVYVRGRSPSSTTKKQQQQQLVSEEDMATSMSRRKGIPQRSPLC